MVVDKKWQSVKVKKLSPAVFQSKADSPGYFLLDVRPLDYKRDTAFITGAYHCPLVQLNERYTMVPREQKILVVDWAMKQSTTAAKFLTLKGYEVAGILRGGMERWRTEGYPAEERDPTEPPTSKQ